MKLPYVVSYTALLLFSVARAHDQPDAEILENDPPVPDRLNYVVEVDITVVPPNEDEVQPQNIEKRERPGWRQWWYKASSIAASGGSPDEVSFPFQYHATPIWTPSVGPARTTSTKTLAGTLTRTHSVEANARGSPSMGFTPKQTAEGDRPHAIRDLETETEPGTINYPSSADVEHMEKDTETFLLSARVGEEVNEDLHWSEDPLDSTKAPAEETLEHTNGDEPTHNAMPVAADGESITSNPDQVGLESDPTQSDNHMHEEDSSAGSWNWLTNIARRAARPQPQPQPLGHDPPARDGGRAGKLTTTTKPKPTATKPINFGEIASIVSVQSWLDAFLKSKASHKTDPSSVAHAGGLGPPPKPKDHSKRSMILMANTAADPEAITQAVAKATPTKKTFQDLKGGSAPVYDVHKSGTEPKTTCRGGYCFVY